MQRKPSQNLLPVYFSLVLILGLFLGYNLNNSKTTDSFFSKGGNNELQEIFNLIKTKYVDEVNADSITTATAEELLSKLDPHSAYIAPSELEITNSQLEGRFTGIGILYSSIDDTLNVIQLIDKGPAQLAGIELGDKIISLNDTINLVKKDLGEEDVRSKMRGEAGSIVQLNILRNGDFKKIKITRGAISISSIDAAYMLDDKTGFIKINKFAERTYEEFMVELEKLQKSKMQNLVLDLRGNGGGYMHAATAIADEFLDGDKLIVYTQGNHSAKEEKRCNKDGLFETGKLTVLIDEYSASASEVLAGALQDWDRAIIVGRRSFGKGLVQQQYNLSNGGALRLTTARYYSPLGRNIQKPYNKGKEKYMQELIERYEDGEFVHGDTTTKKDKQYKTPKGKMVYGGGGITPDVFVGIDTSIDEKLAYTLTANNNLEKVILNYYKQNKKQLSLIKNVNDFNKTVDFTDDYINSLLLQANKDSLHISSINENAKKIITQKLKANFARQLINNQAYYEVMNSSDSTVINALRLTK